MESEKTPWSERAQETRERILGAAVELMAAKGYAGTSVTELCARAQVVRPVLYSHFGSKEGLLGAVVEHVGNSLIDELQQAYSRDQSADASERIKGAVLVYRRFIEERPERLRLLLLITLERGQTSLEVRTAMARYQARAIQTIVSALEDTAGTEVEDLDTLAVTVVSILQNAMVRRVFDPDSELTNRMWDELARTVALGLGHRVRKLRASKTP
ncbi:MAG: TetR/AcrR family transcriptional regulator [Myxococcota bacterium]